MFIIYEDLKEVKQMLCTWQAKHIWANSLKLAEINNERHRFLKEQNQVDFNDKLSLAIQKLSSNLMQKTYCEEKYC